MPGGQLHGHGSMVMRTDARCDDKRARLCLRNDVVQLVRPVLTDHGTGNHAYPCTGQVDGRQFVTVDHLHDHDIIALQALL